MTLITALIEKGFEPVTPKTTLPAIFRKVYAPTLSVIVIVEAGDGRHEVWVRNESSEVGVGDISYNEMTERNVRDWLNVVEQAYTAGDLYGSTSKMVAAPIIPTSESVWRRISDGAPPLYEDVLLGQEAGLARVGHLLPGTGNYSVRCAERSDGAPTHWMPLPEPPKD